MGKRHPGAKGTLGGLVPGLSLLSSPRDFDIGWPWKSTWRAHGDRSGAAGLAKRAPKAQQLREMQEGRGSPAPGFPGIALPAQRGDTLHQPWRAAKPQLPPVTITPHLVVIPAGVHGEAGRGVSLPWGGSTPSCEHRAEGALKHALAMGWGRASRLEARPAPSLPASVSARERARTGPCQLAHPAWLQGHPRILPHCSHSKPGHRPARSPPQPISCTSRCCLDLSAGTSALLLGAEISSLSSHP